MKDFVRLKFLFDSDRTVAVLKNYYDDYERLSLILSELTKDTFNFDNIYKKKILLKPNWVRHSLKEFDELCLRTNDTFVLAVLLLVLKLSPEKILLGDAPIQGCYWMKMLTNRFVNEINHLSKCYGVPIIIKDFRRMTFNPELNELKIDQKPLSDFLIFNLGYKSLLEPVTHKTQNKFRVVDYNSKRMAEAHAPGIHKYCLIKELFEYDIIISLPKVKTHQKAGLTAALKNVVGFNGDKDYLPHHRIGGTKMGGDCYPGRNILRHWAELFLDRANQKQGRMGYKFLRKLASAFWKVSIPGIYHDLFAGWYGNDTTWRMVMDLNKIIIYGKSDGTISSNLQRTVFSLCDGIIGGQGNGPLFPDPLPLGIISFSNNSAINDLCLTSLMNIDYSKIPLIIGASRQANFSNCDIFIDNKLICPEELFKYSINVTPPPGWAGHI
jgi:hypothetical protein